jgi:hypothetical protein
MIKYESKNSWANKNNTSVDNLTASAEAVISTVKDHSAGNILSRNTMLCKARELKEFCDLRRIQF